MFRFQFFEFLFRVDSSEQHFAFAENRSRRVNAEVFNRRKVSRLRVQLLEYRSRGRRHKRCEKHRAHAYGFKQIVKHRSENFFFAFVFRKHPWSGLVNVFVRSPEHREYCVFCVRDMQVVHFCLIGLNGLSYRFDKRRIKFRALRGSGNCAAEILFGHCQRAAYKVAEIVCQVGIVSFDNGFVSYGTVCRKRGLGKNIVSYRVNAERMNKVVSIYNVAL